MVPTLARPQPLPIGRAAGDAGVVASESTRHVHHQRHQFIARPSRPVGLLPPGSRGDLDEQSLASIVYQTHVGYNELGVCLLFFGKKVLPPGYLSGLVSGTDLAKRRENAFIDG